MKEILYNYDYLNKEDIDNVVKRAKILIVNSSNEILLGYSHNSYQVIGGHLEDDESYDECIVREVREEAGIELNYEERKPFLVIRYYCKDYPKEGINSEYIINYYVVNSDIKPDISKINLTEHEKEGEFELRYIHIDNILEELNNNLEITPNKNIVLDTIESVKEYLKQIKD